MADYNFNDMSALANFSAPLEGVLDANTLSNIGDVGQVAQVGTNLEGVMPNSAVLQAAAPVVPAAIPSIQALPAIQNDMSKFAGGIGAVPGQNGMPQLQEGNGLLGGLSDYFSKAGLKDYGTLLGGVGGLYQSVKAGQLADEQIRASKDSRQFAKDEQKRKQDFINSYKNASANAAQNSNYYSA